MKAKFPKHPAFVNLTGRSFGKLTVVSYEGGGGNGSLWKCQCECGETAMINGSALIRGSKTRCKECRSPSLPPKTKKCTKCKEVKPYDHEHFPTCCQAKHNLRATCLECFREYQNKIKRTVSRRNRVKVLTHYSKKNHPECECCGEAIFDFLALDHLIGSSREDYKKFRRSGRFFRHLIKSGYPEGFRILCHNCNMSLGQYGYCAHNPPGTEEEKLALRSKERKWFEPPVPDQLHGQWFICTKCNRPLPLSKEFFHKNYNFATGLNSVCKTCRREKDQRNGFKSRDTLRRNLIRHYSNGSMKCACCGEREIEFLALDHINGGGKKERDDAGCVYYRWLKKKGFPPGLQVLCHNCNQAKGYYGECPHINK